MDTKGFLEELYLEQFDPARFDAFSEGGKSEKIEILLEHYRKLIKDFPPHKLEEKKAAPPELLRRLGEIGIFGLNIPETYGGIGATLRQYLQVVEEMACDDMALAIIPIAHLSIGLKGILLFGTDAQKKKYLPRAASGDMIFAYALTEPNIGSDAKNIETTALLSEDGRHYIINGTKTFITNGNYAGGLTVFAQLDPKNPGHMGAFIVETGWKGVTVGPDMPKMGLAVSSTTAIRFKDVRIPVENMLGNPGDGFKIAMTILNYGRLGLGAASLGTIRRSVEDMQKRATMRKQFGVPIGTFELIQEKIVRARVRSLVVSAMNTFTARLLEEDPTAPVAIESSHCKLYGTTRAWETLYDALQVAGGSGYISTQPYEKRMRDFRVTTVFEGTTEIHSIYPPLYLVRAIQKLLQRKAGENPLKRFLYLVQGLFFNISLPIAFKTPVLKRPGGLIRRNARTIRRNLTLSLLFHGKRLGEKEFLLRRITQLSLDTFALLAVSALLADRRQKGIETETDMNLLAYFLEEAKLRRRENRRFFTNRKEKLHRKIFGKS